MGEGEEKGANPDVFDFIDGANFNKNYGSHSLVQFTEKCWNTSLKIRASDTRYFFSLVTSVVGFMWHCVRLWMTRVSSLFVAIMTTKISGVICFGYRRVYGKALIAGTAAGILGTFSWDLKTFVSKFTHGSKQAWGLVQTRASIRLNIT